MALDESQGGNKYARGEEHAKPARGEGSAEGMGSNSGAKMACLTVNSVPVAR
jgi:hypothetical protein